MTRVLVVVALSAAACTSPNPRSCVDGTCTDPAFPFCDIDGSFFGEEQTCYPVTCTPDEHVACRGDTSYFCNAAGNDYEQRQCPNGCDDAVGGCIPAERCSMNTDCANPTPICDAQECRACRVDDECDSTVCDIASGACVDAQAIAYASPSGVASGPCSQASPCTIARAITTASTSGLGKTVRLLPGLYGEPVIVQGTAIIKMVGTGAEVKTNATAFRVIGGATLDVRGLTVSHDASSGIVVDCGDQSIAIPKSTLTFTDGRITSDPGANPTPLRAFRCNLTMRRTSVLSRVTVGFSLGTDASFDGDSLTFLTGDNNSVVNFLGERMSGRLTNSVLENTLVNNNASDTAAPGSNVYVGFNTFVFTRPNSSVTCENQGYTKLMRYENNILFAQGTGLPPVYQPNGCSFANNILFPQPTVPANNRNVDPRFVDFAARNFKLQADSPAVNTGVPSTELSPTHDHDGVMRPQGAGHDVGAFERTP